MAIPPFPSKGLAKLVLGNLVSWRESDCCLMSSCGILMALYASGYLAEEQLMTAYDEFLQASPYLDAMYNEYDRIFMTSLKSILAEYRAVKIYGMYYINVYFLPGNLCILYNNSIYAIIGVYSM